MLFVKITDPKMRDFIVKEFQNKIKYQNKIFLFFFKQNKICFDKTKYQTKIFCQERIGDMNTKYKLPTLFKPITDMQKDLKDLKLSAK